jgi:group I intron endonuclease
MIPLIGIYKATNLVNQKKYIGQSIDIQRRLKEHQFEPFKNSSHAYNHVFYQAIRKYGIENFSFEIVEECDTRELDNRERYWIKYYNTYIGWENCQGYNMTIGGAGAKKFDPNEIVKLWEEGNTVDEIINILNSSYTTVTKYLHQNNLAYVSINDRTSLIAPCRSVLQYSLKGELLNTYDTISDAIKEIRKYYPKAAVGNICKACCYEITTAYNYIWKYKDDDVPIEKLVQQAQNVLHHRNCPIHQYSLNGDYLQTFSTIKEAAIACKIKCQSAITNVCTNRAFTAGGYRWNYLKLPNLRNLHNLSIKPKAAIKKSGRRGCPIAQYDLNNNLIKIYTNRTEAANAIGGKPQGIGDACCGSKKTYKGYIWKYSNQQ